MSDEVEHYLAVYHRDSCTTTRAKLVAKSVEGVFPREVGWIQDNLCRGPRELSDCR